MFLLDEPEAHLHPKLQGETGERIADLVKSFGAQAIIATHSVEMINRLGLRSDVVLLSVDRTSTNAAVPLTTENEVIDRLESFCDLSPFSSLQLLRSRRVLFHEGKTDRILLEGCARALFANNPSSFESFRRWTFVELSGEANADAKDVLKTALAPLSAASNGGGIVRIVRILDRDYHRQPVLGPEQGNTAIKEFDVVWSRHSIESLFLDPPCLAAWLHLALAGRPQAPSAAELESWVSEGINSANADATLRQAAFDQLFPLELRRLTVGQLESSKYVIEARKQAEARIAAEPHVYQQGKARARHVLDHVRKKLPTPLQNRIPRDVTGVVRHAPSASTLTAPLLVPAEIETVLKYLTT